MRKRCSRHCCAVASVVAGCIAVPLAFFLSTEGRAHVVKLPDRTRAALSWRGEDIPVEGLEWRSLTVLGLGQFFGAEHSYLLVQTRYQDYHVEKFAHFDMGLSLANKAAPRYMEYHVYGVANSTVLRRGLTLRQLLVAFREQLGFHLADSNCHHAAEAVFRWAAPHSSVAARPNPFWLPVLSRVAKVFPRLFKVPIIAAVGPAARLFPETAEEKRRKKRSTEVKEEIVEDDVEEFQESEDAASEEDAEIEDASKDDGMNPLSGDEVDQRISTLRAFSIQHEVDDNEYHNLGRRLSHGSAKHCKDFDVRLIGRRAEMLISGTWLPICGKSWSEKNAANTNGAKIFCSQLGYHSGTVVGLYPPPRSGVFVPSCNQSTYPSFANCTEGDTVDGSKRYLGDRSVPSCQADIASAVEIICSNGSSPAKITSCTRSALDSCGSLDCATGGYNDTSSSGQLLFRAKGSSTIGRNIWDGWYSGTASTVLLNTSLATGKSAWYNHMPLKYLIFESFVGHYARYKLYPYYQGSSLLSIVQSCMGNSRYNDGKGMWDNGHCTIGTLESAEGLCGLNESLRIGVGDGSADGPDWALFMLRTGNGFGDYAGRSVFAFGSERQANTGTTATVTITGLNVDATIQVSESYQSKSSGTCTDAQRLKSPSLCATAGAKLGFTGNITVFVEYQSVSYDPPYCYYENNQLKYNGGTNTGPCTSSDRCVCHASESTQASSYKRLGRGLCLDSSLSSKSVYGWSNLSKAACLSRCSKYAFCQYASYNLYGAYGITDCKVYTSAATCNSATLQASCNSNEVVDYSMQSAHSFGTNYIGDHGFITRETCKEICDAGLTCAGFSYDGRCYTYNASGIAAGSVDSSFISYTRCRQAIPENSQPLPPLVPTDQLRSNWNCNVASQYKNLSSSSPCSSTSSLVMNCVQNLNECVALASEDGECKRVINYFGNTTAPSGTYAGWCKCLRAERTSNYCSGKSASGGVLRSFSQAKDCPRYFPYCHANGDCLIDTCRGGVGTSTGCRRRWSIATNPLVDPAGTSRNYINGIDGNGADCTTDYNAPSVNSTITTTWLNFSELAMTSWTSQDLAPSVSFTTDSGRPVVNLTGNTWKKFELPNVVSISTGFVMTVRFMQLQRCEISAISLLDSSGGADYLKFRFSGSQNVPATYITPSSQATTQMPKGGEGFYTKSGNTKYYLRVCGSGQADSRTSVAGWCEKFFFEAQSDGTYGIYTKSGNTKYYLRVCGSGHADSRTSVAGWCEKFFVQFVQADYELMPAGNTSCPVGLTVTSQHECQTAYDKVKTSNSLSNTRGMQTGSWNGLPVDCSVQYDNPSYDQSPHWNTYASTNNARVTTGEFRIICRKATSIWKAIQQKGNNEDVATWAARISVNIRTGCPTSCVTHIDNCILGSAMQLTQNTANMLCAHACGEVGQSGIINGACSCNVASGGTKQCGCGCVRNIRHEASNFDEALGEWQELTINPGSYASGSAGASVPSKVKYIGIMHDCDASLVSDSSWSIAIPANSNNNNCSRDSEACGYETWEKLPSGSPLTEAIFAEYSLDSCSGDPSTARRRRSSSVPRRRRSSSSSPDDVAKTHTFTGPRGNLIRKPSDIEDGYGALQWLDGRDIASFDCSSGDDVGASSQSFGSSMSGSRSAGSSYCESRNQLGCESSQFVNCECEFQSCTGSCSESTDCMSGTFSSGKDRSCFFVGGSSDVYDGPEATICKAQGMLLCPAEVSVCEAGKSLNCGGTTNADRTMYNDLCQMQKQAHCAGTCVRSCADCSALLSTNTSRCYEMSTSSDCSYCSKKTLTDTCRPAQGDARVCAAGTETIMLFQYVKTYTQALEAGQANNDYSCGCNWCTSDSPGCFCSLCVLPAYIIIYFGFWAVLIIFTLSCLQAMQEEYCPNFPFCCGGSSARVVPVGGAGGGVGAARAGAMSRVAGRVQRKLGTTGIVAKVAPPARRSTKIVAQAWGGALAPTPTSTVIAQMKGNRPTWAPECKTMRHNIPRYWANYTDYGDPTFDEMVYVMSGEHEVFDKLLKTSYLPRSTQDRPCPTRKKCAKTPGGCPCVQIGGEPGLPTGYLVRRVIRVESSKMWDGYSRFRNQVIERGNATDTNFDPPLLTDDVVREFPETFEPLDARANECYLWHGTNIKAAMAIAQNDFQLNLAGKGKGSMYGKGAYFAESCTKADEYAMDDPGGYYESIYALLLCRVCMGKFYYTEAKGDQEGAKRVAEGQFDSVLGDRAKAANTFRELVIFDQDQVYPEFVILVSRIHRQDNEADLRKSAEILFHAQLPIYWQNCHLDPFQDHFAEQFPVRKRTLAYLKKFVKECCTRHQPEIAQAYRVENSAMFAAYVNFKRKLLDRNAPPTPLNELDGDESSGHAITHTKMAIFEQASVISLSNIDPTLNEMLLWHGTSKSAADSISKHGFKIPSGSSGAHGARFGNGAYLAEDLSKSLDYAANDGGKYHILLCRVLAGDMYYTESGSMSDAHTQAKRAKKDAVLANPSRTGPREFIILEACQVYPEFLLEVTC